MKLSLFLSFVMFSLSHLAQETTLWDNNYGPSFRHLKAVEILDNDRFIGVGGNVFNDAISTIIYSDDFGANWTFAMDNVNAILQDVDFTSAMTGYSVGWAGNVWKTTDMGDNWNQVTVPGNSGTRNYNGCYFMDDLTGVVVGGNQSMDSIQTIIRTTDGGDNWSVISDNLGNWLRAVHFQDANNGIAVGDRGTILKTTDGGQNWTNLSANSGVSSRQLNDVFMIDANNAIAVGGWPDNDSIQTIIRTTDGGATWGIVRDNVASMLNAVFFKSNIEGYAVGDDGTLLITIDQGASWQSLVIPNNDVVGLQDVFIKNQDIGLFGGDYGKLLWFIDTTATDATASVISPVLVNNSNSVYIEGILDDGGLSTSITFEYGSTMSFGTDVLMTPGTSDLSGMQNADLTLTGLTPNLLYFGRIKLVNTLGTTYSNAVSFYTGVDRIVNYNFEDWNSFTYDIIDNWVSAGTANKVASYNASNAVELVTTNGEPGAIFYATPSQAGLEGGIPFIDRPDTLSTWMKYDISSGDTALVIFQLKENGIPIADTVYSVTGSTSGSFVNMKFKIDYLSGNTPDTLLIGIVNTNVFSGFNDPNSILTIDDVEFIGATTTLSNYDMEGWTISNRDQAVSWTSRDDERPKNPYIVNRTTDAYAGNYALLLSNLFTAEGDEFGEVTTGDSLYNNSPAFPVDYNHSDLYGFVKYQANNGDTLQINVNMFENGNQIGGGSIDIDTNIIDYSLINIPITYWGGGASDSCSIRIRIHNENNSPGLSSAYIDNLSFDSYLTSSVTQIEESKLTLSIFPNPSDGPVTIQFSETINQAVYIQLFDLNGTLVLRSNESVLGDKLKLDLSYLSPDFYLITVQIENKIYTIKTLLK